jgi:biopolymer transport protein ExbD
MAFHSLNHRSQSPAPLAEINTTPLVDVMLVLLVIFIITAPLLNKAVTVDLPKANSQNLQQAPKAINVSLDKAGKIYLDGEMIVFSKFEASLYANRGIGETPSLHFRADRETPYERVAQVLATAQKLGLSKIAFITIPENSSQSIKP